MNKKEVILKMPTIEERFELRFRSLEQHFTQKRAENTFYAIFESDLPTPEQIVYLNRLCNLLQGVIIDPREVGGYWACQKHCKGNA